MALVKCKECGNEISNKAKACPKCGAAVKKTSWVGVIVLIIIFCAVIGHMVDSPISETAPVDTKSQVISQIKLDYNWGKGGFGSVMMVNFKITNNSTHDVKDVDVICEHFASSGTNIDSNNGTIFNSFPHGKTVKVNNFNMGFIHNQAASTSCRIKDLILLN